MNEVVPGWKTTEAWLAAAKLLVGVLLTGGVISANDASTLGGALAGCITAVAALLSSAYVVGRYIENRAALKAVVAANPQPLQIVATPNNSGAR